MLKSYLNKDTTEAERRQIVEESLGYTDGLCDSCQSGIIDMYDDYIYGKKELKEITMSFHAHYVSGKEAPEKTGCGYK